MGTAYGIGLLRPLTSTAAEWCFPPVHSDGGTGRHSSAIPVQMFIGDGAKLVRDAFALAKEKSPCIIFIDEIDAIGTKRFDSEVSGDREVQRTMLELLNQLDGFSSDDNIKVSWRACRTRNFLG